MYSYCAFVFPTPEPNILRLKSHLKPHSLSSNLNVPTVLPLFLTLCALLLAPYHTVPKPHLCQIFASPSLQSHQRDIGHRTRDAKLPQSFCLSNPYNLSPEVGAQIGNRKERTLKQGCSALLRSRANYSTGKIIFQDTEIPPFLNEHRKGPILIRKARHYTQQPVPIPNNRKKMLSRQCFGRPRCVGIRNGVPIGYALTTRYLLQLYGTICRTPFINGS